MEQSGRDGRTGGYSFKLTRRYQDKQTQEWKDSPFLFDSDLLTAAALLQQAFADLCITRPSMASGSGRARADAPNPAQAPAPAQYVTRDASGNTKLVDENGDTIPF
jgi:hypothetical protein